jgi:transcriptional regulator with XRE-family HTH domain
MPITLRIGQRLKALGVSQAELAKSMGCRHRQYIHDLVHGNRGLTLKQLGRVCDALAALGHPCLPSDLYTYRQGKVE